MEIQSADTAAAAPATALPTGGTGQPTAADREKLKQLAHEFESLMVTQMLHEMRRTMLSDESGQGFGAETMTDTVDAELGSTLSRSGGFGLANVLLRALDQRAADTAAPDTAAAAPGPAAVMPGTMSTTAPATPAASGATPAAAPATPPAVAPGAGPALAVPPDAPVTSPFGWRIDPLNHQVRFHAGTDLRMAYGEDVHAAAGGRIAFAGEQSGYGLTLVIDHGAGVETRYAHLSGVSVRAGQAVDPGQIVARSGSSGRSTGPHLHFEVLRDGRAVDPATVLKQDGPVADSSAYRSERAAH